MREVTGDSFDVLFGKPLTYVLYMYSFGVLYDQEVSRQLER